MTAREWKPGDVAMVKPRDGGAEVVAIRLRTAWFCSFDDGHEHPDSDGSRIDVRPLVVIDPEDAHQVGALADLFFQGKNFSLESQMAALREFANPHPPKPDEPTGLGAVVEDAEGDFWVYVGNRTALSDTRIWQHARKELVFDEIAAVKVLSKGVQS